MLELAFIYCAVVGGTALMWQVIGAGVYDYQTTREHTQRKRHPYARQYRERPLMSIIVLVAPQGSGIEKTLASLRQSNYRKNEIIVMGYGVDREQAATQRQQLVSASIRQATYHFSQVKKREDAIRIVNRRYVHGAYVLTLEAGQIIQMHTIRRAVYALQAYPYVTILLPHIRIRASYRFFSLADIYLRLLEWRFRKSDTVTGTLVPGTPVTITRRGREQHQAFGSHIRYADDVIITIPSTASLRQAYVHRWQQLAIRWQQAYVLVGNQPIEQRLWGIFRLLLALANDVLLVCIPVLCAYCAYVAVNLAQPTMLFVLLGILSLLIIFAILDEPEMHFKDKLALTLGIPLTYGIFIVLGFLRYILTLGIVLQGSMHATIRLFQQKRLREL